MKLVRFLLALALVLGCIGAVLMTDIPAWLKYRRGEIRDFNTVAAGELKKGDLVAGTVYMSLGPCAEEYSTTYGVRTSDNSSKLYYVLQMDNDQLIVYETSASEDYTALDRISQETYDYYESLLEGEELGDMSGVKMPAATLRIEGRVADLPSDIRGWFKELYDRTFDDSDFDSATEHVMIERLALDRLGMLVIIGAVCAVCAIGLLVLTVILWRRKKAAEY